VPPPTVSPLPTSFPQGRTSCLGDAIGSFACWSERAGEVRGRRARRKEEVAGVAARCSTACSTPSSTTNGTERSPFLCQVSWFSACSGHGPSGIRSFSRLLFLERFYSVSFVS
jgi:hypothetical protein